jgi:NhaP-type Na+/H+ or K+/H+ antiporter
VDSGTWQLVAFLLLGIGAQWLAWRLQLPAILLLLMAGLSVGPLPQAFGRAKLIDPDALLGPQLVPVVSLSVAIVLFEGGLSLNLTELAHAGHVIRNLILIGGTVTWLVATAAAHAILGFDWPLASLVGAILIVTGPTVIGPLLRHVRPIGRTGAILKWEGIVIDPLGAMFTVLVFEALSVHGAQNASVAMLLGLARTVGVGSVLGFVAGRATLAALRRFWIPDYLHVAVVLTAVVVVFAGSNLLAPESGLLAVTIMGILLGNQQQMSLVHVVEFKENLSTLLISALFILLSARLNVEQIRSVGLQAIGFTLALVVVARPLAVGLSTIGSGLTWRERALLAWMAPRGIVAASIAALYALRLQAAGVQESRALVPVVFTVIVGTVSIYGLSCVWLSRRLQLSSANPGLLIAGANELSRELAHALAAEKLNLVLVDSHFEQTALTRLAGLPVMYGNVLSSYVQRQLELTGIDHLLALTPNDEVNTLAAMKYARIFGRERVFQLAPEQTDSARQERVAPELKGRVLFGVEATYRELAARLRAGHVVKRTTFSEAFSFADFRALYGDGALPLFWLNELGVVEPLVAGHAREPHAGQTLLSLVKPAPAS